MIVVSNHVQEIIVVIIVKLNSWRILFVVILKGFSGYFQKRDEYKQMNVFSLWILELFIFSPVSNYRSCINCNLL